MGDHQKKPKKTYKPFRLQHWALTAVVRSAVKKAIIRARKSRDFADTDDIEISDDLIMWHQRDKRFLHYEFTYMCADTDLKMCYWTYVQIDRSQVYSVGSCEIWHQFIYFCPICNF